MSQQFARPDRKLYHRTHPQFAATLNWFGPWIWSHEALASIRRASSTGDAGLKFVAERYETPIAALEAAGHHRFARRIRSSMGALCAALAEANGGFHTGRRARIKGGPICRAAVFQFID